MPELNRILYCRCAYSDAVPRQVKDQVLKGLVEAGAQFDAVADLCALAARADGKLKEIAGSPRATIVACHERAVRGLFAGAGAPLGDGARILNMRTRTAGDILQALLPDRGPTVRADAEERFHALRKSMRAEADAAGWIPWFPVIDRDRCDDCKQCAGFCLFGVYTLSAEGKVQVRNPANCKTYCPACARVCPQGAILFPKHPTGPVNGGPPEGGEEKANVDLSRLAKGDVYAALRGRGASAADGERPGEQRK